MVLTLEQIKIKPIKLNIDKSFQVIILDKEPLKNSFNGKLLGRELKFWVKFACGNLPTQFLPYKDKDNILNIVRERIDRNIDYTIVLLSTTALLENSDILKLKEYAIYKGIKLCKLPVGYIVENKYLLDSNELKVDSVLTNDVDNFYIIETKKQYEYALGVLRSRINDFHIGNGVEIIDTSTTYIEPEVDIEEGVTIYPHATLKGNTLVSSGVTLKENSVIDNSTIGENSFLGGSVITGSKIGREVMISSFCEIRDSIVGDGSIVGGGSHISRTNIREKSNIKQNSVIGEANDSDSGLR